MTIVIIWTAYILAILCNLFALNRVYYRALRFMDGVLFGNIYYLVVPMLFILVHGELPPDFIKAPPYFPYVDHSTTVVLLTGMILVPALHLITKPVVRSRDTTDRRTLNFILVIFASASVYGLLTSGVLSGGHWYRATADAMEGDAAFLIIKHVANFARTAAFGALVYWHLNRGMPRRTAVWIGLAVVLIDMMMTFNRVTGVYFLIMILVLYRRNVLIMLSVVTLMLFVIPQVSSLWPMFRGLVGAGGYSVGSFADAASTSLYHSDRDASAIEAMNSVFESVNIVTLNYVVKHAESSGYLKGEMFIRPATFYLPRMVWADRPANFGTTLGMKINGVKDLALNSTMLGEPYANFGPFWWLGLTVLLIAYEYVLRWVGKDNRFVGFVSCFIAFAMWRFDSVFGVIAVVFVTLLIRGLTATTSRVPNIDPRTSAARYALPKINVTTFYTKD